ncbi:MAG TPA: hypothetical protein VHE55_12580 [Fimbriimonadaceae bacterium]|nr:hypothetical protein [Fimbriimonadaceae bacterium]
MIRPQTVSIARSMGPYTKVWLVPSFALFLLQFLYPFLRLEIEQQMWVASLSQRPDAHLSIFVLDGALSWFGLLCGFCISSVMYAVALNEWRGQTLSRQEMFAGLRYSGEFVKLSFVGALLGQTSWWIVGSNIPRAGAVFVQLGLTVFAVTPAVFVMPLIIDKGMTAWQALISSFRTVARQPMAALLLVLLASFWAYIGAVLCGIGVVFTLSTYQLSVAGAYLDCYEGAPEDQTEAPQG